MEIRDLIEDYAHELKLLNNMIKNLNKILDLPSQNRPMHEITDNRNSLR